MCFKGTEGFFLIELKNVVFFQKAINSIAAFINEGNFRFSTSGFSFKAIDPSQIVLVNYSVAKNAFDKYDMEPLFVGVDLTELNKIMQRSLPNDRMQLNIDENEMLVKFEGELSRSFKLPLIDINEEEVNIPTPKFDAKVTINARILKEALKDAGLFGSSVILRAKTNLFTIEARGSQGTLKTVTKETTNTMVSANSEVVSKYSLNFLQNIIKEADNENTVVLELKSDAPMKASFKIGESTIEFYLAHMIL